MLELSLVFLTVKVSICFKSPLIVPTLNHLYEFTHLGIPTSTDRMTAVNIITHMLRLARLSPRCVNVAPARKCR